MKKRIKKNLEYAEVAVLPADKIVIILCNNFQLRLDLVIVVRTGE